MRFRHHPDGIIFINDFSYPLAEFLIDEPNYSLPPGMIAREYEPGVRHVLRDGRSQHGGPNPWPEGDQYLLNEQKYRDAYAARQSAGVEPPDEMTVEAAKDIQRKLLRDRYEMLMDSGFTSSALGEPHRYSSDAGSRINLLGATLTALGGVEDVYECTPVATGVAELKVHTAAQMQQVLIDGATLARQFKTRLNARLKAIDDLPPDATIEDVQAITWDG